MQATKSMKLTGKVPIFVESADVAVHTCSSLRFSGASRPAGCWGVGIEKHHRQESHMQKKLIAVAIAGALGTPAAGLAQTSTVNIYGNITFEYGIGDQGSGKKDVDYADTPGGSAI